MRRQHKYPNALLSSHRVLGRAPGIARSGTKDIQLGIFLFERVLEKMTQELHRHVFEGQRRTIGQRL